MEFRLRRVILPTFNYDVSLPNNQSPVHTRAARGVRGALAVGGANGDKKYKMDFKNMIANVNNVKPGCRKCGGAR
jgi:hypothetical protein